MTAKTRLGQPSHEYKEEYAFSDIRILHKEVQADILFGCMQECSLSDHVLVRNFNRLYDTELDGAFWECLPVIECKSGSKIRHMSSTDQIAGL